jgi:hypothetical protein
MRRERREKLLQRFYHESDNGEPGDVTVKLSQEAGKTNRERREFSSLIKHQYLGAIDAHIANLADQARGK